MQLDNLDYRIITEALYHLATNPDLEIGDKAVVLRQRRIKKPSLKPGFLVSFTFA